MAMNLASRTPKEDRVRSQTKAEINRQIDRELEPRLSNSIPFIHWGAFAFLLARLARR